MLTLSESHLGVGQNVVPEERGGLILKMSEIAPKGILPHPDYR